MGRLSTVDAATSELLRAGVSFTVAVGSNSIKVRWTAGGRSYLYCCSKTPSEYRATLNARSDVRRMLREAGVL